MASPSTAHSTASVACASSPAPARRCDLAALERQPHRGVALGDERDALDGVDERRGLDRGDGRGLAGQQRAVLGELAVEQAGRRATAVALEADEAVAGARRGQRECTTSQRREGLRGVGERAGRHQRVGLERRCSRVPRELAHGQAVAVGGRERDRRSPSISMRMPVSVGRVSSRPAAIATCATAAAKVAPATVPVEPACPAAAGSPRPAGSAA